MISWKQGFAWKLFQALGFYQVLKTLIDSHWNCKTKGSTTKTHIKQSVNLLSIVGVFSLFPTE